MSPWLFCWAKSLGPACIPWHCSCSKPRSLSTSSPPICSTYRHWLAFWKAPWSHTSAFQFISSDRSLFTSLFRVLVFALLTVSSKPAIFLWVPINLCPSNRHLRWVSTFLVWSWRRNWLCWSFVRKACVCFLLMSRVRSSWSHFLSLWLSK